MLQVHEKKGVAERCRSERKTRGFTQMRLAEIVACTQSAIVEIERAGSFSDRLLRDVASALNIREEWLRTGHGQKEILPLRPPHLNPMSGIGRGPMSSAYVAEHRAEYPVPTDTILLQRVSDDDLLAEFRRRFDIETQIKRRKT